MVFQAKVSSLETNFNNIFKWWATKTRFAPKVLRAKLLARTHPTLILMEPATDN